MNIATLSFLPNSGAGLDRWIIVVVSCLLALGLVMVASSTIDISAAAKHGNAFVYMNSHFVKIVMGVFAGAVIFLIPTHFWQNTSGYWLMFCFVLLVLVLIPGIGKNVNGSTRWIRLGFLNLQASELVKVFMVVYVAGYLVRHGHDVKEYWLGFLKPMVLLGLIGFLLLLEPDFGGLVVLFSVIMGMLFLAGMKFYRFILLILGSLSLGGLLAVLQPYRVDRLTAYMNPWADENDTGYQLIQALAAFGRGGIHLWGVGLGNSVQKQAHLPEAHTDFIVAIIGEELGFIGVVAMLMLFAVLVFRCFQLGYQAEKRSWFFHAYLLYGIALLISIQSLVNIGVNVGLLPTKGLTLPFVSYGGSSMLANCILMGMALRISYELRSPAVTKKVAKKSTRKAVEKAKNTKATEEVMA